MEIPAHPNATDFKNFLLDIKKNKNPEPDTNDDLSDVINTLHRLREKLFPDSEVSIIDNNSERG